MEEIKFRNFCIIVLGQVEGVKDEIRKVSETELNILEAKNIIIATFSSVVSISEMSDYFKSNERIFILFEMKNGMYVRMALLALFLK